MVLAPLAPCVRPWGASLGRSLHVGSSAGELVAWAHGLPGGSARSHSRSLGDLEHSLTPRRAHAPQPGTSLVTCCLPHSPGKHGHSLLCSFRFVRTRGLTPLHTSPLNSSSHTHARTRCSRHQGVLLLYPQEHAHSHTHRTVLPSFSHWCSKPPLAVKARSSP